jgi:hypothetical protein
MKLILTSLVLSVSILMSPAAHAQGSLAKARATPSDLKEFPFSRAGQWNIRLIARQASGAGFFACVAERIYGQENVVMVFDDGSEDNFYLGFSNLGSGAQGRSYKVKWWADKPDPVEEGTAVEYDHLGLLIHRIKVDNEGGGPVNLLSFGKTLFIKSPKEKVWSWPLAGSNNATTLLFDCVNKFSPARR